MEGKDLTIKCLDCGTDFIFTEGEQRYYKERGLYPPKRCYYCRQKRKNDKLLGERKIKKIESFDIKDKYGKPFEDNLF